MADDAGKEKYKRATQHRMSRRSHHCDYTRPGIYHITIKTADALGHPLGHVIGDVNKPDGDPDAPRVALSPIGQMVQQELLHSITAHYPMVEVQDYVIMPEHIHCIIIAHDPITTRSGTPQPLGQVIAGFKIGCNRKWWRMTGRQIEDRRPQAAVTPASSGESASAGTPASSGGTAPAGTPASSGESAPAGTGASSGEVIPAGAGAISSLAADKKAAGPLPSLFSEGFTDVQTLSPEQLQKQREYIRANPRSRLLRTSNRAWLQPRRGGIDTALTLPALRGFLLRECHPSHVTAEALAALESRLLQADGLVACDTYGDRGLLARRCLPVICHRRDSRLFIVQQHRCMEAAAQGAVLVSPRIAKGEQAIMDVAVNQGFPVILIADNGFPEIFHPSADRIDRCSTGQLLLITPWQYHYRPADEDITRAECKAMNCLAQALCRIRDDWWKQP